MANFSTYKGTSVQTVFNKTGRQFGRGLTAYDNAASLPLSGNSPGDQAYDKATNALSIWNGNGWFKVGAVNTVPLISTGVASYDLSSEGVATVLTLNATDPEGLDITWSYSVSSGSLEDTTVTQADNVFTITPGSTAATFNLTFTASDGVNSSDVINSFTLEFPVVIDLSNATYVRHKTLGSPNHISNQNSFSWNSDGTKIMIHSYDRGYVYNCSTPYNISTMASSSSANIRAWVNQSTSTVASTIYGLVWNSDIQKVYWIEQGSGKIWQYSFNGSSGATVTADASIDAPEKNGSQVTCGGLTFYNNGSNLFVNSQNYCFTYNLSTPWDISTAVSNGERIYLNSSGGARMDNTGSGVYAFTEAWLFTYHPLASSTPYDISQGFGTQQMAQFSTNSGYNSASDALTRAKDGALNDTGTELTVLNESNPYKIVTYTVAS